MLIYSDYDLQKYKKNNLEIKDSWAKRNFCALAQQYFQASTEKIFAVCGLRATGKTVGLLQAATDFDVVYVLAQENDDKTGDDYIKFLKNTPKKYIIIDEYGWIKERKQLDRYLLTAVQNGKRIIITGTESIVLNYLKYGALNHRVNVVHTTLFPYDEYIKIYNLPINQETCDNYLFEGGIFKDQALKDYSSTKEYVEDAIVKNLAGYLKDEIDEEYARTLTYAVLFKAVCPSNLSEVPTLRESKTTMPNFLEAMGVNVDLAIKERDLNRVADIFKNTGIITKISNIDKKSIVKEKYYINNPSLTSQLIMIAYSLPSLDNSILGHIFEACAMTQLATNKLYDHEIYFYDNAGSKNNENKELDIIITDSAKEHIYFFECKHSQSDKIKAKSTILSGYLEKKFFCDADIDGRYIIYNGSTCIKKYDVGDIIFTPLNDIINNYFLFSYHLKNISRK